jgi:phenylacetate-CoA ligase
MESLGATVLVCTPSYALHLLQVARERGLDPSRLPVRVTVHAGEPGAGIPAVRARIEEGWGARAFDHAGMTEMGAYGYECQAQAGLHVNESEFIAEVIDPATGAASREGELVLTNLGRLGSPLIRYRTGDRVRLADGPCACGRTFVRLEGGILGRLDDMLIVAASTSFPRRSRPSSSLPRGGVPHRGVPRGRARRGSFAAGSRGRRGGRPPRAGALRATLGIRLEVAPVDAGSLPRFELKARRVVRR